MDVSHLDADAPDLAALLRTADPQRQRQLSRAAAAAALGSAGIDDPRIEAAFSAFDQGRFGDSPEAEELKRMVEDLDDVAWTHQAKGSDQEYVRWFRRARAASALLAALQEDTGYAAYYSGYEALAATRDAPALRQALGAPEV